MTTDDGEPHGETVGELHDRLPEDGKWISIPELGVRIRRLGDGVELHRWIRGDDDEHEVLP